MTTSNLHDHTNPGATACRDVHQTFGELQMILDAARGNFLRHPNADPTGFAASACQAACTMVAKSLDGLTNALSNANTPAGDTACADWANDEAERAQKWVMATMRLMPGESRPADAREDIVFALVEAENLVHLLRERIRGLVSEAKRRYEVRQAA